MNSWHRRKAADEPLNFKSASSRASQRGITAFEFVFCAFLAGVLMAVQITVYQGIERSLRSSMEAAVVSSIRTGINLYFLDPARGGGKNYPASLDGADRGSCGKTLRCFEEVLRAERGLWQWSKLAEDSYRSPASRTNVWRYDGRGGRFEKIRL
ncbi:MAG: hypothetical protein FGM27_08810 [Candidatus Omnitrophica bacterium]|nr:hypothetical protein [Candidatus Omnitrophota bacterium]